jgi:hypothetical protein
MSELLGSEVEAVYELKSRSTAQCGMWANARIGGGCVREVLNPRSNGRTVTVGACPD